jgi:hypothetical protein
VKLVSAKYQMRVLVLQKMVVALWASKKLHVQLPFWNAATNS